MKTQEEIHKFIKLRAKGFSFDKIARRLKISKPTLINWSKKYAIDIANLRSQDLEALREEFCLSVETRVRMWGQAVNRITEEIARRNLRNVTTERLFDMLVKAQNKLEQSYIEPVFISEDEAEEYRKWYEVIESLQKQDILGSSVQNFTKTLPELYQNQKTLPSQENDKKSESQ